ncbi:MAG: hypothetical protein U5P41_06340 [Gammaproteobacteria bacterium]|nr:hypothetical protein [Gammaproteobacteria bacterium]
MGMVMGLVGSARDFIFNNLMIAGGVVLAIIVLLAGMMFMRQRQVRIEEEADAMVAAGVGTFPDFAAGDDIGPEPVSEDDSESVTEVNAAVAESGEDQGCNSSEC